MKSKANLASRIEACEVRSGAKHRIESGILEYDQPSMRFTFKDTTYDEEGIIALFKAKPYLFVLTEPSSDSYNLGYGTWFWLRGDQFQNSRDGVGVADFLACLKAPPEPVDVERGKIAKSHEMC